MFYNKVHSDLSSYKVLSTVLLGWVTWNPPYLVVVVIVKENSVHCRSESLYITQFSFLTLNCKALSILLLHCI